MKSRENDSKVRRWNATGLWPWRVCGSRVTSDIRGYGTYFEFKHSIKMKRMLSYPKLLFVPSLVSKYEVVRSEMYGAV